MCITVCRIQCRETQRRYCANIVRIAEANNKMLMEQLQKYNVESETTSRQCEEHRVKLQENSNQLMTVTTQCQRLAERVIELEKQLDASRRELLERTEEIEKKIACLTKRSEFSGDRRQSISDVKNVSAADTSKLKSML
jgi:chromosome segregation ATPase